MVFLFLFVRHNNDGSCQSGCVALDFKHMTTVQLKVNETLKDLGLARGMMLGTSQLDRMVSVDN